MALLTRIYFNAVFGALGGLLGFFSSGLVHYSFRRVGIALPRDTRSLRRIA